MGKTKKEEEMTLEDHHAHQKRLEQEALIADHREFSQEFSKVADIAVVKFGQDNSLIPKIRQVAEIMSNLTDQEIIDFIAASEEL